MTLSRRLLLCLAVLALLPLAAPVRAADSKAKASSPIIILVDMQRILDESVAAKGIQKQLETQRSRFQTKTEGEENELRKAEQDLDKSHDQVAADAYAVREQQLRQRFLAVERHVQARRKVLDQGFTDSMNEVRAGLLAIVQDVAHERGANLVLMKQQALWADKSFDVTDEVLDRLNKKLPQVTVSVAPDDND